MTFTITEIALIDIALPLKEPFRISSGVTSERRIMLVRLTGGDGTVGWGECVAGETPHYSPETVDTCRLAVREWIAPLVLGQPLEAASALHEMIDRRLRGHRMAKAAVEMAAWALDAERRGVSLSSLIGGERETIPVGISLGIQPDPAALAAKALEARDRGYRRIKLKVAPGKDVAYVAAVREAVGPNVTLSVDANAAYTLADADHLRQLDAFGLAMIEQPLEGEDLRRHAALQGQIETSLCLDESITSAARVEDMIALGSARIVNIKPGRVGGLTVAKGIHDLCAANGIPVWCGGMLESGIGRAHNVALASLPNFTLPGDLSPSARYWARDIVTPEWTMSDDGMVRVPREVAGIGVAVDVDRVDDLTTHREEHAA